MYLALPAAIHRQEMSNLLYGANISTFSKSRAALDPGSSLGLPLNSAKNVDKGVFLGLDLI